MRAYDYEMAGKAFKAEAAKSRSEADYRPGPPVIEGIRRQIQRPALPPEQQSRLKDQAEVLELIASVFDRLAANPHSAAANAPALASGHAPPPAAPPEPAPHLTHERELDSAESEYGSATTFEPLFARR